MGDIAIVNPTAQEIPDQFYYIDLESVSAGVLTKLKIVNKVEAPSRAQRVVKVGDVLFQTVRPYQQNNYIVSEEFDLPVIASTGYAQIRTKNNPRFLYSLLHTVGFLNEVLLRCTGSNYPAINSNDLKEISIYLPERKEQDKIAYLMLLLDKKIEKQRQLVEALKSYKRGVIQRVFSGEITGAMANKNWGTISISELFTNIIDKGYPEETVLTIIQGYGTIPRDSVERRISYDSSSVATYKRVINNDFILHLRSFEGGLEISNHEGIVSPAYTILRSKKAIEPAFFYAYFRSYEFIENKLRIAVEGIRDGKSINMDTFWKIHIPFPSLEVQQFYANLFSSFDRAIDKTCLVLTGLENAKKFLLQQLFI